MTGMGVSLLFTGQLEGRVDVQSGLYSFLKVKTFERFLLLTILWRNIKPIGYSNKNIKYSRSTLPREVFKMKMSDCAGV